MIETLTNLKNNRVKADASSTGAASLQSTEESFKKHLKALAKKQGTLETLRFTVDELRQSEERGKWWVIGNAWQGDPLLERQQQSLEAKEDSSERQSKKAEEKWISLARKQGMNTVVRQSIFVALMSSEDYVDAKDRLFQLGLTEVQQREIVRVILHCLGNEKAYNPFYTLVMQHLLTASGKNSHSFAVTLQYSLWDLFREMGEENVGGAERLKSGSSAGVGDKPLSSRRARNLSLAFGWWFAKGGLSLTSLKPLPFFTLLPHSRDFLIATIRGMFKASQSNTPLFSGSTKSSRITPQAIEEGFLKVAPNPTLVQGLNHIIEGVFLDSDDKLERELGEQAIEIMSLGRSIAADVDRLM